MSTPFAWVVLGMVASMGLFLLAPEKYAKGAISRFCSKIIRVEPLNLRFAQMLLFIFPVSFVITHLVSDLAGLAFYNTAWAILCLDDYLFGDDDDWKKFKEWAKNKVKWKMDLPQLVPVKEQ